MARFAADEGGCRVAICEVRTGDCGTLWSASTLMLRRSSLSSRVELEVDTFLSRSQMSNTSTILVIDSTSPSSSHSSRLGGLDGNARAAAARAAASTDDLGVSSDEVDGGSIGTRHPTLRVTVMRFSGRTPRLVTPRPAASARAATGVSTMSGHTGLLFRLEEEDEEAEGMGRSDGGAPTSAPASTLDVFECLSLLWTLDCCCVQDRVGGVGRDDGKQVVVGRSEGGVSGDGDFFGFSAKVLKAE